MKALCWHGKHDIRVETVPDPGIINPHDAIVRVTATAICGSDLHIYNGFILNMKPGDILGHEFMGEVVEVGPDVHDIRVGDRVVVPFAISCGQCFFCRSQLFSLCDNTNPNAWILDKMYGASGGGMFGYSHFYGGYAGGQAEFVRVPFADVGLLRIPEELDDEQVLFLSDILPTGWQAAESCAIRPGDTVAVWGCGPVGLFAQKCARILGAERVIAIDAVPDRLEMARQFAGCEALDYSEGKVVERLQEMTGGMGPDACIDAVGMESHGMSIDNIYDYAMQRLMLETDRAHVLREAIQACRKGGVVSIPGVYTGMIDKVPMGAAFAKGLTFKMGQTHVQKHMRPLLERIQRGDIDPPRIITHRLTLDEGPGGYGMFDARRDHCIKIVMRPGVPA